MNFGESQSGSEPLKKRDHDAILRLAETSDQRMMREAIRTAEWGVPDHIRQIKQIVEIEPSQPAMHQATRAAEQLDQMLDRQTGKPVGQTVDAFATEQDRATAIKKAQGEGTFEGLVERLRSTRVKVDRSRLSRWRKDRFESDKTPRARERLEYELSRILATLK